MSAVEMAEFTEEQLIKALHQRKNAGPATLSAIQKALPKAVRPTEAALQAVIHAAIREGRLWEYFPKGDEPHYWTESPDQRARQVVRLLLEVKDRSETELKKKLAACGFKSFSPDEALSRQVAAGSIHRRPAGRSLTYSLTPIDVQQVTTAAWQQVELKLSTADATEKSLQTLLRKALQGVLEPEEFLRALVVDGKIFRHLNNRYSLQPIDQKSFSKLIGDFAKKLHKFAEQNGVTEEQILQLAERQLREHFGSRLPPVSASVTTAVAQDTPEPKAPVTNSLPQRIIDALHQLNPRVADGDLVAIPVLRQQVGIEKRLFDQVLLELYRQRQVVLSRISAAMVADQDRDDYVVDEDGVIYNTVALWKE